MGRAVRRHKQPSRLREALPLKFIVKSKLHIVAHIENYEEPESSSECYSRREVTPRRTPHEMLSLFEKYLTKFLVRRLVPPREPFTLQ